VKFRLASQDDCALLAELNYQLIQEEGHELVDYAFFELPEEIYLRQSFVVRHRRRLRERVSRLAAKLKRAGTLAQEKP
jgi:hypothetical protein